MATIAQHLLCHRLHAIPKPFSLPARLTHPKNRHITNTRSLNHPGRSESTPPPLPTPSIETGGVSAGSIFFTSLCVITFGLGVWQTSRYYEKVELEQKRSQDLNLPPLTYHEWCESRRSSTHSDMIMNDKSKQSKSYRLVTLRGEFQHDNQLLIGPRGPPPGALAESGPNSGRGGGGGMSSSMQGYWVVTPLVISSGDNSEAHESSEKSGKRGWFPFATRSKHTETRADSVKMGTIVWINRGWIPRHFISNDSKILRQWDQPQDIVEITTMESETETPGRFSPPSKLNTKTDTSDCRDKVPKLLWLDRQAMAELTNCPSGYKPPLFVQIKDDQSTSSTIFPVRSSRDYVGEFKVTPEIHAGYAATWFGLSGAGVLMTRKLLVRGR